MLVHNVTQTVSPVSPLNRRVQNPYHKGFSLARITDATEIEPFGGHPPKSWFYNLWDGIHYLPSSSQTNEAGFLNFSTPVSVILCNFLFCPLHCRAFSGIPGLYSLNVGPPSIPSCNIKISWHRQMTPTGQKSPQLKTTATNYMLSLPAFYKGGDRQSEAHLTSELEIQNSVLYLCTGRRPIFQYNLWDTPIFSTWVSFAPTPMEPRQVGLGAHWSSKPFLSARKHLRMMTDNRAWQKHSRGLWQVHNLSEEIRHRCGKLSGVPVLKKTVSSSVKWRLMLVLPL